MRGHLAKLGRVSIGLAQFGCTNRPFYQMVVFPDRTRYGRHWEGNIIEQIGSFDPIPNVYNEKLVAINFDRLKYWIARDAYVSVAVLELLGLCGFMPLHPETYVKARRARNTPPLKSKLMEGEEGIITEEETDTSL